MRFHLFAVLFSVLVLAACGREESGKAAVPSAFPVTVQPFSSVRILPERDAPASVIGKHEARLAAETVAVIAELPVDVVDSRDAELALARAEAGLAQSRARLDMAEAQLKRALALREKNFISAEALTLRETERTAAQADFKAALANRDTARRGVEKCTLRAPFDAVVRSRSAQLGEFVSPGAPLMLLVGTSDPQVAAQIQIIDAEGLKLAQDIEFISGVGRLPLALVRLSAVLNREARTLEARFAFSQDALPPGSEGRVVWHDHRSHLPADLVLKRGDRYGVFVAEGNRARFVTLEGAQEGRPVVAELGAEDKVIVQGRHALAEGMEITVAPETAKP
ncbi:MAG: multidrug efflux system subunit MdtA [Betaproteobacteria bacterium ADurb.Bin341]|nr:MAG: multidrug efflux system subunit MdtA [Betaproteobacteria bacterium ADurb.Bin341]